MTRVVHTGIGRRPTTVDATRPERRRRVHSKDADANEIAATIAAVTGRTHLTRRPSSMTAAFAPPTRSTFVMIAQGLSNPEIGDRLGIDRPRRSART